MTCSLALRGRSLCSRRVAGTLLAPISDLLSPPSEYQTVPRNAMVDIVVLSLHSSAIYAG